MKHNFFSSSNLPSGFFFLWPMKYNLVLDKNKIQIWRKKEQTLSYASKYQNKWRSCYLNLSPFSFMFFTCVFLPRPLISYRSFYTRLTLTLTRKLGNFQCQQFETSYKYNCSLVGLDQVAVTKRCPWQK